MSEENPDSISSINPHTNPNMQSPPSHESNPHHPASPYFIQPSESASSLLVPELLITENYMTWVRTKRRALNIKNKLGFIDGKIPKPIDTLDPLFTPWEHCNDMIITWIQHPVSLEHRSTIAHADTAHCC